MLLSPRKSASRELLPFQPEPLQARIVRYEPPDGGEVLRGFYVTWKEGEGAGCRLCPRARCTLEAVPESDTATCLRILRGEESDRLAAALGLDPEAG